MGRLRRQQSRKEECDWDGEQGGHSDGTALPDHFASRFARRAAAQPSLVICRPRATASASAGTSLVMHDPAPMYAPSPIVMGATNVVSLPTKTRLPISVRCFAKPS